VDHRDGLALGRNQNERSTRRLSETEQGNRHGVDVVKLIEKPTIESLITQSLLDPRDSLFRA